METREFHPSSEKELDKTYPYDAIVVLPYTRVKRTGAIAPKDFYRRSHFTTRAISVGWELYQQNMAPLFILPGEQKNPATSDLEREFLIKKGVAPENIIDFPNLNGTAKQLKPIADLQDEGKIGKVLIVSFESHQKRVQQHMELFDINGDIAEVERTHVDALRARGKGSKASREKLINMPQLKKIKKVERIARKIVALDRPFGRRAPVSRLYKFITGPTITDIKQGKLELGLVRIEAIREALNKMRRKLAKKN